MEHANTGWKCGRLFLEGYFPSYSWTKFCGSSWSWRVPILSDRIDPEKNGACSERRPYSRGCFLRRQEDAVACPGKPKAPRDRGNHSLLRGEANHSCRSHLRRAKVSRPKVWFAGGVSHSSAGSA